MLAPPDRLTSDLMGSQLISAANHVPELVNVATDAPAGGLRREERVLAGDED